MKLSDYILDTSVLLGDSNNLFTSQTLLTRFINDARREVAKRTGCLCATITGQSAFGVSAQPGNMIPGAIVPNAMPNSAANNYNFPGAVSTSSNGFNTIPGVERYDYSYGNSFLQQQYAGYKSIIYVRNVSASWGTFRPTLDWLPWEDLQAYCRSYNLGVASYPAVWSQDGVGERGSIYLFPVPSISTPGEMEWEVCCTPADLNTNDDYEALPHSYQSAVMYWAAYRAYMAKQRSSAAAEMRQLFEEMLISNSTAVDWGHSTSHYNGY